jgi:ribosomal protein L7/L12
VASNVTTAEWIEELKGISVMELSERIKALEEEFGVSATAVAAAATAVAETPNSSSSALMRSDSSRTEMPLSSSIQSAVLVLVATLYSSLFVSS